MQGVRVAATPEMSPDLEHRCGPCWPALESTALAASVEQEIHLEDTWAGGR